MYPKITFKASVSLDGFLNDTSATPLILSSTEDLQEVHQLRAEHDAILIGGNTLRTDNPELSARNNTTSYPLRIIVSNSLEIPADSKIFSTPGDNIIYTSSVSHTSELKTISLPEKNFWQALFTDLQKKQINSILIEAGNSILLQLMKTNIPFSIRLAINPLILGSKGCNQLFSNFPAEQLELLSTEKFDQTNVIWMKKS